MTDKLDLSRIRSEIEAAETRLKLARERLAEAEREAAEIPPEPKSDFITFNLRFTTSGVTYRYAAIRAAGRWYTTGGGSYSWEGLVKWIQKNHVDPHGVVITELTSRLLPHTTIETGRA